MAVFDAEVEELLFEGAEGCGDELVVSIGVLVVVSLDLTFRGHIEGLGMIELLDLGGAELDGLNRSTEWTLGNRSVSANAWMYEYRILRC